MKRPFDINKEKLLHRLVKERKERIMLGDAPKEPYKITSDGIISTTPDGFNQSVIQYETKIESDLSFHPLL